MELHWHIYVMAFIYVIAGINHFRNPRLYIKIIPPYFPNPKALNAISGVAEILLGIGLCIPAVSNYAAWGVIALLIAIFPAHIYMYFDEKARMGLPKWVLLLRMPLQIALIYWAYQYT
ncbi:DoxX family protein [Flavobacterium weaverense]|uniref:Putative membrane protein n=1 Tax=Flavobacterium weaverense TaxID=271156 RepID=A0A3L9ZRF0_9FLAO|nr:DoxX family protein [Flavobacterium weaverense]RMA74946.1 putative membrane protein [Flavobacterium weaverense]